MRESISVYEQFFGLRERPFQLTPDPRFLFLTPQHREALATLRYGLGGPRGITLLLGEAGTGKTTLLRAALGEQRGSTNRYVLLSNPTLTRAEFYEYLADGFKLRHTGSKTRFLLDLQREVIERNGHGGVSAIAIDEAQSLPYELLEEVRLLGNLETATSKLLTIVLVGQQELAGRLDEPSLRQLKQRIGLRCSLAPLDLRETAAYIAARLNRAGAEPREVFTRDAILAIHEASGGIPRTIGVLGDNALLGGFAAQQKPVDVSIVAEVCRDFGLGNHATAPVDGHVPGGVSAATALTAGRVEPSDRLIPPQESSHRETGIRADGNDGAEDPAPIFGFVSKKRRFSFF